MLKSKRRWLAAFLLLVLLSVFPALAQETAAGKDAGWYDPMLYAQGSYMHLLTEAQLNVIAQLPSEEIHAIVEAMFLAAAGVKEQEELQLWKNYKTQAARDARSAENAAYRVNTLPWLAAAFAPGNRPPDGMTSANAFPAAEEMVSDNGGTSAAEIAPAWQLADGMAAFAANANGDAFLRQLSELGGTDDECCMAVTQAVVQRWLAEIDHEKLTGQNGHYQFWLYAPDTPIDYPVVQCGNNSYYLERMFNRKSNPAGTLFVDYRNLPDFQDPNTLIYGHHMRDGAMFHSLTDYESRGFYEAHPFMVAISRETIYVIEVFAGYVTDGGDHCYDIAISDEEDMRSFVALAQKKSNFDSHVQIDCGGDRLVTLSTCAYNFENARYIVIGRLNPVWENGFSVNK